MEGLLEFVKGPLFRLSFAILTLGLLRLFILSLINGFEAKAKAKEKKLPMNYVMKLTLGYVFPIRAFRVKPLYSAVSILFHVGLILTPLLLFDHILLIFNSIGISWFGISLSHSVADLFTILTISTGIILLILRISSETSRYISRRQDFIWILLLLIPFITGLVCANVGVSPDAYNTFILIHILSGELIFILMPFTKIAHCILMPITQWVTARSWKFPQDAGEKITRTLGKEGEPI